MAPKKQPSQVLVMTPPPSTMSRAPSVIPHTSGQSTTAQALLNTKEPNKNPADVATQVHLILSTFYSVSPLTSPLCTIDFV